MKNKSKSKPAKRLARPARISTHKTKVTTPPVIAPKVTKRQVKEPVETPQPEAAPPQPPAPAVAAAAPPRFQHEIVRY